MKHQTVVYVMTTLELGGAQKVCLSLFKHVHSAQFTTYLIAGKSGPLVTEVVDHERAILLPQLQRTASWFSIAQEIGCLFTLIRLIRTLKRKHSHLIVHTHSSKAGILGRWAAWCARVPSIHTIHGFAFHQHQSYIRWFAIFMIEWITSLITTHFVCVSSHDAAQATRLFFGFAHKHSIIRACVDHTQFIPARKASEKVQDYQHYNFGTISCLKPQKNLFDLLKAFAFVYQQEPRARLHIIGDGQLRPAIQEWIYNHNLIHAVILYGWQLQVNDIMQSWYAFVLSSLWEGLPCAIIEARLIGLPILAYNTGGINDVIHSGVNGFLYPQKNWLALAQGMIELIRDKHLHYRLSTHKDMLADFTISSMINEHRALYKNLK